MRVERKKEALNVLLFTEKTRIRNVRRTSKHFPTTKAVVKVRGLGEGGGSAPAPIWAPAIVWDLLIESIKCYFTPK